MKDMIILIITITLITLTQLFMAYVIFRMTKRINHLARNVVYIENILDEMKMQDKEVDKLEKFKNLDGFFTQPK